ncbi:MAG: M36 family metallopeptidase [Ferruginibacter sp.]
MKKLYLFFSLLSLAGAAAAQDISKNAALQLVSKNASSLSFTATDLENSSVSSAYHNKTSNTDLVYLQQTFKGLPVLNKIQTLAFRNGALVYQSGTRLGSLEKRTGSAPAAPALSAENAVRAALTAKKMQQPAGFRTVASTAVKAVFEKAAGITDENITADLLWVPDNNESAVKLAWQVYLVSATSSDYWLIRVDARNGSVLNETNLTVYCNFDSPDHTHHNNQCISEGILRSVQGEGNSPEIVNGATYRVIPYPAESPIHPGGTPALRTDPWTLAPGNATSLKWHSDGTNDWTYTRGNNVWAYHDRTNLNTPLESKSAQSTTTPDPLTFDFTPDFTVTPIQATPVQNQPFNITNLFYWNNIIHDMSYQYGFDEVSGNFQVNNQGRGGQGNDYVRAEAQDAGGTNNANFSTPADGSLPRMQMYLWSGSPQKDGDVDNGVVTHEYGHGVSTRLTGGPANSGCLGNSEQMGEGWSDYLALMYTQNWATAAVTDGFNSPRGMGTYVAGQAITGVGIRPRRYTTNMAVNEMTYANLPSQAIPHGVGFLWCTMLWDMTWEIIQQAGINPNLFNASGAGGNTIALKLVMEGMKLQPCSPGFIDGRDAILQADQLLYGGQYRCAIVTAFARRGLGFDAKQGSSGSTTDGTAGFSNVETNLTLTQSVTQQLEGLNVTYNNKVSAGPCAPVANYLLTDTLPANVTYVSGGTYNTSTRVVSFPVNLSAGQSQTYSFTIMINNGSYFPTVTLLDEQVTNTGIPAGWATSSVNSFNFTTSNVQSHSAPNALFAADPTTTFADFRVATTTPVAMGANPSILSFWHNYNTEGGWDGGMVEISTNGGTNWTDLGTFMTENPYNGSLGSGSNNPLANRSAFTGNSNGWIKTSINLASFVNQNALFRFRFGADDNTGETGWYVDDILLQSRALVNMKSNLFNASGVRVQTKDTITIILQNSGCTPVSVTTQPQSTNACVGTTATFTVATAGNTPVIQWQVSTDGGNTWTDISGATSATLSIPNVTLAMNNNRYRANISNACPSNAASSNATLTVTDAASITGNPANASVCLNSNTSFSVTASGSTLTYQWQVSTDGGNTWTNIASATGATLNLTSVTAAMNNNRYRAVVFSCGPNGVNSSAAILTITSPANITSQPASVTVCPNANATFSTTVNGSTLTYQWQVSSNGGTTWTNIGGAINSSYTINGVNLALSGNMYRVIINGTCTVDLISSAATLTVNQPVTITSQPDNKELCVGESTSFSVTASGSSISYQWQVSVNGGPFVNLSNAAPYSGVNTATLTITNAPSTLDNYTYRVIVDGPPCGSVTSSSARITVHSLPGAVLVAAEYATILPGLPAGLYVTVSPPGQYTYEWIKDGDVLGNVTGNSYLLDLDKLGTYYVNATDQNGCSVTTNMVTIRDSASKQLFIYPNPSNGNFQVRYYNPSGNSVARTLVVYDSKGARVYSKAYTVAGPYGRMDISMPWAPAGVYIISLLDANNKQIISGRMVIQR